MKDIAIYRLERVDKALERLDAVVARLETAVQSKGAIPATQSGENGQALTDVRADMAALRSDYDALHAVASKVADRLDGSIDQLKADTSAAAG